MASAADLSGIPCPRPLTGSDLACDTSTYVAVKRWRAGWCAMGGELPERVRLALVAAGIVPDDGTCGDRGPRDAATPARASVGTLSVASDTADSGWAAAWAGVLEVVARELAAASAGA